MNSNTVRGGMAILGAVLMQISVGEFSTLGTVLPHLVEYYKDLGQAVSMDHFIVIQIIWLLSSIAFAVFAVALKKVYGYKEVFMIFLMMAFIARILAAYITNMHIFQLTYGLLLGGPQGALLILPTYRCFKYYSKSSRHFIIGFTMTGYAIAPLILTKIAQTYLNPKADSSPPASTRISTYFIVQALACLAIGMSGWLMILDPITHDSSRPSDMLANIELVDVSHISVRESSYHPAQRQDSYRSINSREEYEINLAFTSTYQYAENILISSVFWCMFVVEFTCYLLPIFVIMNFKTIYAMHSPAKVYDLNWILPIGAVFSCLSRPLIALLYHNIGYMPVSITISALLLIISITNLLVEPHPWLHIFTLWSSLIPFGSQKALYPLVTHTIHGTHGALAYGLVFTAFIASYTAVRLLNASLMAVIGYRPSLVVMAAVACLFYPAASRLAVIDKMKRNEDKLASN